MQKRVKQTDQLVTQSHLKKEFLHYNTAMAQSLEDMRVSFRKEIHELFDQHDRSTKEMLLSFKDEIVGYLKKFEENQDAALYRLSEHSDQLEDHEERITRVELRFANKRSGS